MEQVLCFFLVYFSPCKANQFTSRDAHRTGDSGAQSAAKALRVKNFEAKMGKIADFDYSANNTFKSKDPNKTKNRSLNL